MAIKQVWATAAIIRETSDAITVEFDTRGIPFKYAPGQYIDITLLINDTPVTRSYSLSSSPEEDINPSITVKRVNGGIMSNFIIDNISNIKNWHIDGPYGNFTPLASTYNARHVILMGGGSGITPLYSISRSLLNETNDTKVTVIYSSHSPEGIIFRESIERLMERFKGRLNCYFILSQSKDDTKYQGITVINGRLNRITARELITLATDGSHDSVQCFICGPSTLMKMHREVLESMQVPAEHIFMEWYAPEAGNEPALLPQEAQEVLLHFYEQTNLLEVQAGQTILASALADRIPLPYSCKTGTCGRCTARLTSGKVKMINNHALRHEDIDEGMILLCQSYPLTDDVTVEIA